MPKLLYIEASPRRERSFSSSAAQAFIARVADKHSNLDVDHLNLWGEDLPRFAGGAIKADAYRLDTNTIETSAEARLWAETKDVFNRFNAADAYLIATPMWNFGVPYLLKHYFDVMAQPGLAFQYHAEGTPEGLVKGRPAVVIAARGGAYLGNSSVASLDHQLPWLNTMLRFIGFETIETLAIEPTIGTPDELSDTRREVTERAQAIADIFKFQRVE